MKKLPMLLQLIVPYIILICGSAAMDITVWLVYFYGIILLFNMVYAFWLPKLGFDGRRILFWNLLLKLCNIPVVLCIMLFASVMTMIGGKNLSSDTLFDRYGDLCGVITTVFAAVSDSIKQL